MNSMDPEQRTFMDGLSNDQLPGDAAAGPPKVGARFSRGPLRILKSWFSTHQDHPYPGTRDLEELQAMTGLSRQQITTWLSNARRRTKSRVPTRPTSPGVPTMTTGRPLDIPQNGQHPSLFDQMDPLQRWQHSPPEHEAASTAAILNAVSGSSDLPSGSDCSGIMRRQPSLWGEDSSASSIGTSLSYQSSGGSAHSHLSDSSRRRSDPLSGHKHRKRRNRVGSKKTRTRTALSQAPRRYQCTFCTETFTTKHNWQRHEKSLHLSSERWECSPDGPYVVDSLGQKSCTYCNEVNPDMAHMRTHNYDACEDRPVGERSFYRKDHLFQHLNLVHHTKYIETTMDHWKHDTGDVKSRCGFCNETMLSWGARADHIAEHFKAGQTMAEWVGDWGFEEAVLERVENAIPPYLIDYERHTPWPFTAEQRPEHSPVSAFELIKLELDYFSVNFFDVHLCLPSPEDLLYESCCVIFGAEMLSASADGATTPASWLRDILMSSDEIARRARLTPMKTAVKYRMTDLSINGKTNMFENCSVEERLQNFVGVSLKLGSRLEDRDLRDEACHIVEQMDRQSSHPSMSFVQFLTGLITSSNHWLIQFRRRTGLPEVSTNMEAMDIFGNGPTLSEGLAGFVPFVPNGVPGGATNLAHIDGNVTPDLGPSATLPYAGQRPHPMKSFSMLSGLFDTTDRFYRQFNKELARFITSTMSPRNPQSRIPTDEELQHQARWIMFESDDPWNQTPADNGEWLRQFKAEHGLAG